MSDPRSAEEDETIAWHVPVPERDLLSQIPEAEFPVVLRGYDRAAVDGYVAKVEDAIDELSAVRVPSAAVTRALERVGEEVGRILREAHETAEEITAGSRRDAETRLEAARAEAQQIVASSRQRLRDLDAEADRIWAERERILEDVRELSSELLKIAEAAAKRFPAEAEPETQRLSVEEIAAQRSFGAKPVVRATPRGERLDEDEARERSSSEGGERSGRAGE